MERRRSVKYHLDNINMLIDCMLNDSQMSLLEYDVLKEHLINLYNDVLIEEKLSQAYKNYDEKISSQTQKTNDNFNFEKNNEVVFDEKQQKNENLMDVQEESDEIIGVDDSFICEEKQDCLTNPNKHVENDIVTSRNNVEHRDNEAVISSEYIEHDDKLPIISSISDDHGDNISDNDELVEDYPDKEHDTDYLSIENPCANDILDTEFVSENQDVAINVDEEEHIRKEKSNYLNDNYNTRGAGETNVTQTIADIIGNKIQDNTLGNKIFHSNFQNIKSTIDISDKFMFIKNLFDNDVNAYNETIDKFSSYTSVNDSKILMQLLINRYNWNYDSDIFKKFEAIIEKRFE